MIQFDELNHQLDVKSESAAPVAPMPRPIGKVARQWRRFWPPKAIKSRMPKWIPQRQKSKLRPRYATKQLKSIMTCSDCIRFLMILYTYLLLLLFLNYISCCIVMVMCAPIKETVCFCCHLSGRFPGVGKELRASGKCKDCHGYNMYVCIFMGVSKNRGTPKTPQNDYF